MIQERGMKNRTIEERGMKTKEGQNDKERGIKNGTTAEQR